MSDIFKVSILNKSGIDKIFVFYGSKKLHDGASEVSPTQYFKMEPNSDPFENVFNNEELRSISENNIDVEFVNLSIRLDDSVEEIKRKIIIILNDNISFDEIYLFSLKEEAINLVSSYQNITQNEKLDLTKDRLTQFLLNFVDVDISELSDKSEYDYDDLLSLNFKSKEYVKKPIGQKFFINDLKYQYTVNPFDVLTYDKFLEKHAENIVTTQNRTLLLDFGKPKFNTIYCCLAEDVFEYINSANIPNLDVGSTSKIYYPFLFKQNIYTLEQLQSNKLALIANNKAIINKYSEKKQLTTDLLYDIYDNRKEDLSIKSEGIKRIEFIIHQNSSITLPIDVVFKLIHASNEIPFIKLNPGNRKEKLYRIFTNSISSDGRKIPYLNKAVILRLSREIGKTKRMAMFIENHTTDGIKINSILELDGDGNTYVNINLPQPQSLENCEDIIKLLINPVLTKIKEFIEQSGYQIDMFNKLSDKNIEIVDIKYSQLISIDKNIHLSKYVGCVSNCFNIIEDNLKKGIVMRYKKVSNFNIMSSQQALIIELVNKGFPRTEVITSLTQNFNIERSEAEEVYIRFISEVEVERGLYENKRLKIRDNPGFLTTIKIDNFTSNIIVEVSNIDNVLYLETIPKMLFSIISLTQNTYNKDYKHDVSKICKKKSKDTSVIVDIVAPAEQQFQTSQKAKINELQDLAFIGEEDEEEGDDDYLAMLLGVDEEEEENIAGGSTPEDDIVIGSDISLGSDSENETTLQEGNIPTGQEMISIQPKESQSGDDIKIGDSISMTPEEEEQTDSKPNTPEISQTGDIEIGDSISMTPDEDNKSKTPKVSQTNDIEMGDSISMSPEKEESKSKTPEVSQTSDIAIGDSISMSPEKEESKSKTPEVSQTLEQETESADNIEIGNSVIMTPEEQEESKPITTEADIIVPSKDDDNIASVREESVQSEDNKSETNVVLPQPQVEIRRGLSLESQQSTEGSIVDDSSISVGSDIDIDEMTKVSSKDNSKIANESVDSISVSPAVSDDLEDFERDITGTQLNNPYYFQARMERRDPVLFVKSMDDPKFKAYSRMCPSNVRRQPVILTEKEKERIDKEHPGSYSHAVKYGSDPNKQFYYICPRYWCIKDNTSLTEEEVNAGVCGGRDAIIPAKASKIPKGKYIYEFNAKREHDDGNGNYLEHAPGFLSKKKHPKGMCLPCCFKNWDAPEQKRRRDSCAQSKEDKATKPPPVKRQTSILADDYIKDETKFPLEQNRWGVLPIILQNFLNVDKRNCALSGSKLAPFKECLLRHGVEVNKKQSFIACIADLYVQYIKSNTIPTIKEMKEIIKNVVTLDVFMESHNGNLVQIFSKESDEDINFENYRDSKMYKSLDMNNSLHREFLRNIIVSHNNFKDYLDDDEILIDYKYLWDIVTNPGVLFPSGINLVLLEITNYDTTQNVQLICPTNHYAKTFYNARKSSFILVKQGDYYEPIYLYEDTETQIKVQKTFSEYSKLAPNLKKILNVIKSHINRSCNPLPSMPKVYSFVENNGIQSVMDEVKKIKATIESQIMNYNGKIIGLVITINPENLTGFIPCYPSGLTNDDVPVKTVDDSSIWKNYDETMGFLLLISGKSKGNILCKPMAKIVEDELVVGILTETNQFIQLSQPEMPQNDGLATVKESNYLITDSEIMTNKNIDSERIKYVKRIKLEKNFYDVFRNSLRILLNKYENRTIRENIQELIESNSLYYDKMNKLTQIIHNLMDDLVVFVDYDEKVLMDMEQVSSCLTSNECDKPYCMKTDSDDCKLLIPRINLLNELENEVVYFAKISDELLRFNRIKLFIFDPKTHLNFGTINYDLNDNEIILLSSLLTQDYFKDLVPITNNSYIRSNTYDTANPIKTQIYSSEINNNKLTTSDCKTEISNKISGKWKNWFDSSYKEIIYPENIACSYKIILDIMNEEGINDINSGIIRATLLQRYNELFEEGYRNMIYNILYYQGKVDKIRRIKRDELTFENWVLSESYYLTNLDIWLLANKYNLGVVLISSTKLIENRKNLLPLVYPENGNYYFIKSPGVRNDTVPKNRLIVNSLNKSKLSFTTLGNKLKKLILSTKTLTGKGFTLEKFLSQFKPIVYKQKKKQAVKLVLGKKDDDSMTVASSVSDKSVTKSKKKRKAKKLGKKLKLTKN